ncbi:MAG: GTPase SAR1 family protein [Saprospiraceae bacterium]|jgi:GTPase SAR1 family protein
MTFDNKMRQNQQTTGMMGILNEDLQIFKSQIEQIVKELHDLTIQISHEELSQTISDLRNRIQEPFMFVIVGEVKAGKSSFINALLDTGREICKVAPSPMTDTIQQIVYGTSESETIINPYLKRIHQPIEILKEIAIVDTPGTNTIIEHHQEITERFIPASDLIVFVFEAKNPYRQSAWAFFKFIKEDWQKKIIFVLQQKDLMNEADLQENIGGVQKYAVENGIQNPIIFAVSAKQELDGQKEISGFSKIRAYIQDNITGGQAPYLKLQNNIEISQNINVRIEKGLKDRDRQYEADILFRDDIRKTLDSQEIKSKKQVTVLVENLLAAYDKITLKYHQDLAGGLSFFSLMKRSIAAIFSKESSAKEWLNALADNLEKDLNLELKNRLNDGVVTIAEAIQQMAKIIDLKIKGSKTILKNDHEIFSDIAEKRANVLQELQAAFAQFMKKSESFADEGILGDKSSLAPNLATGSGVAAIGVIIMALTNGAIFDITGGILTTIGVLFAGVSVGLKRRKVINGFQEEISRGRIQMENEVSQKLNAYIHHIKNKIDGNFDQFDQLLEKEQIQVQKLNETHSSISERLSKLENELSKTKKA